MHPALSPTPIIDLAVAFWGAKTLLSAVELDLFTTLAAGPLDREALVARLHLHPRAARDFLDALVALGMLTRTGETYANTPETDAFLVRGKPEYVGDYLDMLNTRLYPFWGALTEALRTGQPQNEAKHGGDLFGAIYGTPERLRRFVQSMTGLTLATARAIAQHFPWAHYRTFIDLGTAQGALPVQVALAHPHIRGGGFDLPAVQPHFDTYVQGFGLAERLRFFPGDFFTDPLPAAEVYAMGRVLHDWDLATKRQLIAKVFDALPPGGAFLVHEALIDDDRRQHAYGLLMSLNMLIADFRGAKLAHSSPMPCSLSQGVWVICLPFCEDISQLKARNTPCVFWGQSRPMQRPLRSQASGHASAHPTVALHAGVCNNSAQWPGRTAKMPHTAESSRCRIAFTVDSS